MKYLFLIPLWLGFLAAAVLSRAQQAKEITFVKPTLTAKEISVVDKVNAKQELSFDEVADYIASLNKNAGKVLPIKGNIMDLRNHNLLLK